MSNAISDARSDERPDERYQRLAQWSRTVLSTDVRISVASADASFRRYFRATLPDGSRSFIVMDAPPAKEDLGPYIHIADMLVQAPVNAPKVLAENREDGFLLLTDLGSRTYLAELADRARGEPLYRDALRTLVQMQVGCAGRVRELPPYDAALLDREMDLFPDWFLAKHLQVSINSAERALLAKTFATLRDSALAQPRVFVHRDYHSRNLMVTQGAEGPNPGVLDFQDAVHGPITYDLVSLLRDCYIAWPLAQVHQWLRDYRALALPAGLHVGASAAEFIRWFDLMGMQRHLKAIGIFSRLAHRDGKHGYLNDIPRTLRYIRDVLPSYSEFNDFAGFIESRIAPSVPE